MPKRSNKEVQGPTKCYSNGQVGRLEVVAVRDSHLRDCSRQEMYENFLYHTKHLFEVSSFCVALKQRSSKKDGQEFHIFVRLLNRVQEPDIEMEGFTMEKRPQNRRSDLAIMKRLEAMDSECLNSSHREEDTEEPTIKKRQVVRHTPEQSTPSQQLHISMSRSVTPPKPDVEQSIAEDVRQMKDQLHQNNREMKSLVSLMELVHRQLQRLNDH